MNEILKNIYRAILEGVINAAQTEVRAAVDAGISGGEILNTALIPVSNLWARLRSVLSRAICMISAKTWLP